VSPGHVGVAVLKGGLMSHHDIVFFIATLSAFSEVNDTSEPCAFSCKNVQKGLELSHKLPGIGHL
jgi:hypothetical protein